MSEAATPEAGGSSSNAPNTPASTTAGGAKVRSTTAPTLTARARRRREEAVRRLVADVQSRPDKKGDGSDGSTAHPEAHEWMVASAVATAIEKGLDRDLHADLVQEQKDNASRISQICHDHSEVFLASVAKVAALGGPSADLANGLQEGQRELEDNTAGPMHDAALLWEEARQAHARAKTLHVMVTACQQVAQWIERAKKQASLGRPRAALDAVDEARTALTTPMSSLFSDQFYDGIWNDVQKSKEDEKQEEPKKRISSLEDTPFGRRAIAILPKIENQVLMNARRGLNGWFLALRSGGDGAKAGKAVLRKCAHSMAMGPGSLGLGGLVPPSYEWRAKTADNLISRVDQSGSVARAVRVAYWFERDGPKEAELLEATKEGMERRAEAFAAAFGWHRCWSAAASLLVDPSEFLLDDMSGRNNLSGSRHGGSQRGQRTLGFRASAGAKASFRELSLGASGVVDNSRWSALLTPSVLFEDSATKKEDDAKLVGLSESVHPVRRAEQAFSLLGKAEEFVQYYEQNRFGDTKIGSSKEGEEKGGKTSYLSSLTGDDVSVGTDRIFFAQRLPHLCSSVVGFSAVEAALELGTFPDDDEEDKGKQADSTKPTVKPTVALSASRFRQSSERYERALVTELGTLLRGRAKGASLPELVRASSLMAAFRSALRTVHPSSTTRRSDRELLAMDKDILMIALKVAQEEMLKAASAIMGDDNKSPMLVESRSTHRDSGSYETIPEPEEVGLPFGLVKMKMEKPSSGGLGFGQGNESHSFSASVPVVVRSIHARAIACAAFALNQEELGQVFPEKKKGNATAGYVLDCVEECINVAAVAMKDSDNVVEEANINKAVQVMANLLALQNCLPRLFGTLMRGMCHVGLIRSHEVDDTFAYAEKTLKGANKACDAQVGSMYSLVYDVCRKKLDSHINLGLGNYNWVAKTERDMPNAYVTAIVDYLGEVFGNLGSMDEGSRNGLHFSCCGHLAERLVKLLTGRGNETSAGAGNIPPISKIDAFGIKNLSIDVAEFIRFADGTGVQGLRDCFDEIRNLTSAMLDRDLPVLLMPENASARNKRYPFISMEKIHHILEKYIGTGFGANIMGGGQRQSDMLMIEKKDMPLLLKVVRTQL
ncbi:Exocyst complex subunit Sec15-like [Seminavis robusta]|uniref:Exocyst complex subunit Sec15-like n=1 Tax=Seminavis robusta TaxID=568900 RepID=A0A9N8E833_9STRA|nr:Exocyst complex subunit Sec15-like [Seminavis robusta]|eukprot:Sro648_g181090.1 Exocyst complex subunit Sec15-like (1116) ;mRNA; r:34411-37856